ncbi:MAG: YgiQ family radical SAM protein [Bacteroidetes bacterium]|nr:YgiQ family radical SAM protein [Bacteroidota bacterium]
MAEQKKNESFLPITLDEIKTLGWDCVDVILVTGDAYVDHPSFGASIIGRLIEYLGFRVAILPQPNWQDDLRDFKKLGKPRLFFGVTAGNMDSMVNHYTALKRLRSNDVYTPGGRAGARPDYATIVYSKILKQLYPEVPIIIGGVEASMRRFTHYDYWSDSVKPSILVESGADMLVYGMAEKAISQLLKLLDKGVPLASIKNVPQTSFILNDEEKLHEIKEYLTEFMPSHEECSSNKEEFAKAFRIFEESGNQLKPIRLVQEIGKKTIVANPPVAVFDQEDLDVYYGLPYTRLPHPKYKKKPPIPAYDMIKHSVTMHRGCFGGCSFCTISAHQGKFVSSRSEHSILKEVSDIAAMSDFKGYVSDLGGPSANMYKMQGFDMKICYECKRHSCLFPRICNNLNYDHRPLTELYKGASEIKGVKKIIVSSGVRYDMLVDTKPSDQSRFGLNDYMKDLIRNRVSGRLKVAPEHTSEKVLSLMRKPSFRLYKIFHNEFLNICNKAELNQQIIPYFISGHPATTQSDMANLAAELKKLSANPEQVQEFTPTPMTLATTIYYTGINPYTGEKLFVEKNTIEKRRQKDHFFASKQKSFYKKRKS